MTEAATIAPVAATPLRPGPGTASRRSRLTPPAAVGAVVTFAYVLLAVQQWVQIAVKSWDLSIFAQLLDRYASLQAPIVEVKGDGYNLLGDHFHPLLALLAPIYAVFPHAFTLLVIQALCFGVAAGLFTAAARRRVGSVSGVLLGLVFGLSWGLQYAADAQFHEVALAVPLLTASVIAILDSRLSAAALWAAPLVFVKEDLGLTVIVIGLLIVLKTRSPKGLWLVVWGAAWFFIATVIVLPLLNPGGEWAYAGNANLSAVLGNPASWFAPSKIYTLALLLAVTGGLILRSPIALIALPTLAWRFLSTNEGYWGPTWHYSAILMPVAFVALLDAIGRGEGARWAWLRTYTRSAVPIAVTAGVMLLPSLPLHTLIGPGAFTAPDRAAGAAAVLRAVPASASVETDVGLMSYLVDDHTVYWIGNANPVPDCILVDHVAGGTPAEWGDVLAVSQLLHPGTSFAVVLAQNDYELACQPGSASNG